MSLDLSVYLVLDPELCADIGMAETARLAVQGGVTLVQLRDKQATTRQLVEAGREVKAALAGSGVPLIINDNVVAAVESGADGVHVGQDDVAAEQARAQMGADKVVGLSVDHPDLATSADPSIVDYVGVGPVFETPTKADHKTPIGFEGLTRIAQASLVPAVAIGGIKHTHAAQVIASGAQGLAVVSAICGRPDPARAARVLAHALKRAREE